MIVRYSTSILKRIKAHVYRLSAIRLPDQHVKTLNRTIPTLSSDNKRNVPLSWPYF